MRKTMGKVATLEMALLTWDVLVLNGYLVLNLMVPACILPFLRIWVEKGIGLIVPGLVPSPLGEVVDYAPSWLEISVTLEHSGNLSSTGKRFEGLQWV